MHIATTFRPQSSSAVTGEVQYAYLGQNVSVEDPGSASRPFETSLLSRENEVSAIRRLLTGDELACLVISGEAGIGKTSLWYTGLDLAASLGFAVLRTRASEADARLPFAALIDLFDGIDRNVLLELPAPQSRALNIALCRADPDGRPADPMALSAALLTVIRCLAARQRLLVAVDDVHWLDASSLDPLVFAARRCPADVRFLVTRRPGRISALEEALLQKDVLKTVELGGLSSGAIGRLLSTRLGLKLARPVLRHLHETCRGNPLFALEFGRHLLARPPLEIGAELPLPLLVEDLFGSRVRQLSGEPRRALLAVSLTSGATLLELARVVDAEALEDSLHAGLLSLEGSRVWPSHPLLAAAMRHEASAGERRRMHRDLASTVDDPILRARHSALAAVVPDRRLAAQMDAAAALAAERGAVHEAAELAAHAVRLTAEQATERGERLLMLARRRFRAADLAGAADLLRSHIDEIPAGRSRAYAHLLIGEAGDLAEDFAQIDIALAEAGEDPEVRVDALTHKAGLLCLNCVERISEAEALAREAVTASRSGGRGLQERSTWALVAALVMRGRPLEPSLLECETTDELEAMVALQLAFRGQVEEARSKMRRLLRRADSRGDTQTGWVMNTRLCELELRAGHVPAAEPYLQDLHQWIGVPQIAVTIERLRAQMVAVAGDVQEARRRGEETLEATWSVDYSTWDRLEVTRMLGLVALLEGDAEGAADQFGTVWDHTEREGVDNPGVFPVAASLVEACTLSGRRAEAAAVAARLHQLAEAQEHPWGLPTAERCAAIVRLADHYDDGATQMLAGAASAYGKLDLEFDQAQSLLYLGRAQRRYKKRAAARGSLSAALAIFERNGSAGWAWLARSELDRVSGRSPAGGELTASERRVAALAVAGLSNKQIAGELFISARTVEIHLSHAYAKLGVRSRSQLARTL